MKVLPKIIAATGLLMLGCLPDLTPDEPGEVLTLHLEGTCAPANSVVEVVIDDDGFITLRATTPIDLPPTGSKLMPGVPLRQGDAALFGTGCLPAGRACPEDPFRYCTVVRQDWYLQVSCLDGAGRPACSTRLFER